MKECMPVYIHTHTHTQFMYQCSKYIGPVVISEGGWDGGREDGGRETAEREGGWVGEGGKRRGQETDRQTDRDRQGHTETERWMQ